VLEEILEERVAYKSWKTQHARGEAEDEQLPDPSAMSAMHISLAHLEAHLGG